MVLKLKPKNVSIQPAGSNRKTTASAATSRVIPEPKKHGPQTLQNFNGKAFAGGLGIGPLIAPWSALPVLADARTPSAAVTVPTPVAGIAAPVLQIVEPAAPVVTRSQTDGEGAQVAPFIQKNRRTRREASRRHIDLDQPGFIKLEDVLTLIPVSRAAWYAGIKSGEYASPVLIGRRSTAYRNQDIKALIDRLSGSGEPATAAKGVPTP